VAGLQLDINKLSDWPKKWQMDFNVNKYAVVHLGPSANRFNCSILNNGVSSMLRTSDHEKDLGIVVDLHLNFDEHNSIL